MDGGIREEGFKATSKPLVSFPDNSSGQAVTRYQRLAHDNIQLCPKALGHKSIVILCYVNENNSITGEMV